MMFDFYNWFKHKPSDFRDEEDMFMERARISLEQKRQAALDRMGTKWIMHPDHRVQKKVVDTNTLGFK
jgi:hypothetical protein